MDMHDIRPANVGQQAGLARMMDFIAARSRVRVYSLSDHAYRMPLLQCQIGQAGDVARNATAASMRLEVLVDVQDACRSHVETYLRGCEVITALPVSSAPNARTAPPSISHSAAEPETERMCSEVTSVMVMPAAR